MKPEFWDAFFAVEDLADLFAHLRSAHNKEDLSAILQTCFGSKPLAEISPKKMRGWFTQMRIAPESQAWEVLRQHSEE